MTEAIKIGEDRRAETWLVGLLWDYCEPGDAGNAERLRLAEEEAGELARAKDQEPVGTLTFRHNLATLIGVAWGQAPDLLRRRALVTLALSADPATSWIARYRLAGDRDWLVMVRDGIVMADGDQVLATADADEVWTRWLNDDPTILQRQTASWEETQATLQRWRHQLGGLFLARLPRLQPRQGRRKRRRVAMAVAVAAVVLVSTLGGWQYHQQRLEEQVRAERVQSILDQHAEANEPAPLELPWVDAAPVAGVIQTCLRDYGFQAHVESGWQLVEWRCEPGQATVEWERLGYGTYHGMPAGTEFDPASPDTALTTRDLDEPEPRGWTPIARLADASKFFGDLYLIHGVAVDLNSNENGEAGQYATQEVVLRHDGMPSERVYQLISSVPGLVLERITIDQHRNWEIRGVLYAATS